MSSEFRFLQTSLLIAFIEKTNQKPKTKIPQKVPTHQLLRNALRAAGGQLQVESGCEPRYKPVTCQDTRASTGAEQGDPRLQSFRLQGDKSQAVPFLGVSPQGHQLGLFLVNALSLHCLKGLNLL